MTDDFIKSSEFLTSFEWRKLRQEVIIKYGNKCMCCGADPSMEGVVLNVDHIKPRKTHPEYALDINNLQILCNSCNHGKGNWHAEDWRDDRTFIVTESWLNSNRTERGGITGAQMKALGFKGTPKKGWIKNIVGKRITEEARKAYEDGKYIKTSDLRKVEKALKKSNTGYNGSEVAMLRKLKQSESNKIQAENRALKAKFRYIRNKSIPLLEQIIDTASLDAVDVWIEVFSGFDDVVYRLKKL